MILVWKSEGRKLHERHRRKWDYNIKMYPNEIGYKNMTGFSWLRIGKMAGSFVQDNGMWGIL
jgi:hypothetical protein